MAAITAALALGSLALGAAGAVNQYEGMQNQKDAMGNASATAQQQAAVARQRTDLSKEQAANSVVYSDADTALNKQASQIQSDASVKSIGISKNIAGLGQQIQDQNSQAMELNAKRSATENLRNLQRARSLALTTAQAQGGNLHGSNLQGAYGQSSGQANTNFLGIQQNLQIGENIAGLNSKISQQNLNQFDLQSALAVSQAGLQTQKADLVNQYAKTNADLQSRDADLQGQMATLGGQITGFQSQAQLGASQAQFGSSLISAAPNLFSFGSNLSNAFGIGQASTNQSYAGNLNSFLPLGWNAGGLR